MTDQAGPIEFHCYGVPFRLTRPGVYTPDRLDFCTLTSSYNSEWVFSDLPSPRDRAISISSGRDRVFLLGFIELLKLRTLVFSWGLGLNTGSGASLYASREAWLQAMSYRVTDYRRVWVQLSGLKSALGQYPELLAAVQLHTGRAEPYD